MTISLTNITRPKGVAAALLAGALGAAALGEVVEPRAAEAMEGRVPKGRLPLSQSPAYQRGMSLDVAGRYREALPLYEEASRDPGEGRARYHRKLTRGLLTHLDHVKRFPQDGRAHFSLGVDAANKVTALVRETGMVQRTFYAIAEEALKKAIRLLPGINDPAICLAGLYADAGEPSKAKETLAQTGGRANNPGEIYNLACYYHSMGRYEEAIATLAKVMNPHYRGWIQESDDFYRLRGDPRLEALMRSHNGGAP